MSAAKQPDIKVQLVSSDVGDEFIAMLRNGRVDGTCLCLPGGLWLRVEIDTLRAGSTGEVLEGDVVAFAGPDSTTGLLSDWQLPTAGKQARVRVARRQHDSVVTLVCPRAMLRDTAFADIVAAARDASAARLAASGSLAAQIDSGPRRSHVPSRSSAPIGRTKQRATEKM